MMIKEEEANQVRLEFRSMPEEPGYKEHGDLHAGKNFDYMLSNPPLRCKLG